jgi:biopolymer transport protein ExbD
LKSLLPERKKNKPQIVVTNLIDVVLLLVFFFMITSSFATNKEKVPVNVPKASNSTSIEKENLTVQIGKNSLIFIAGKQVESEALKEQIKVWTKNSPERPILVEADKDANYGRIVTVLDQIRSSGASNIGLTTLPIK